MKTLIQKLLAIPGVSWAWSMKSEIALLIIALIGFAHIAGWMRAFDSTAAPLDIGTLSAPAVGVVGVVIGVFLFWILWRLCFPKDIDEWFDGGGDHKPDFLFDFFNTSPAVRLFVFFGTLWAVLLAVGLITMALR
jgi:hypothetical protein